MRAISGNEGRRRSWEGQLDREGYGREQVRLKDKRSHREQIGMDVEGEGNCSELRCHRKPYHCGTARKQDMAAGASGGRQSKAEVIKRRKRRRRPKSNRRI